MTNGRRAGLLRVLVPNAALQSPKSLMRWPIQRQLLVPMLLVVLLTSLLSSVVSAWVGSRWAKREEYDRLNRVVATLSDANFPLQETVLQKLAGLSGAEFVVWDTQQQVQAATLALDSEARTRLKAVPDAGPLADLSSNPTVRIQGRGFLTAKVPLRRAATRPLSLGSSGDPGRSLKTVIRVRVPIRMHPAFLISESETHCAHGWELTHG